MNFNQFACIIKSIFSTRFSFNSEVKYLNEPLWYFDFGCSVKFCRITVGTCRTAAVHCGLCHVSIKPRLTAKRFFVCSIHIIKEKPKNESTLIFNLTVAFEPEILESLKKFRIFRKIFNLNGGFEQKNLKAQNMARNILETGPSYF